MDTKVINMTCLLNSRSAARRDNGLVPSPVCTARLWWPKRFQCLPEALCPRLKRPGRETDNSYLLGLRLRMSGAVPPSLMYLRRLHIEKFIYWTMILRGKSLRYTLHPSNFYLDLNQKVPPQTWSTSRFWWKLRHMLRSLTWEGLVTDFCRV